MCDIILVDNDIMLLN